MEADRCTEYNVSPRRVLYTLDPRDAGQVHESLVSGELNENPKIARIPCLMRACSKATNMSDPTERLSIRLPLWARTAGPMADNCEISHIKEKSKRQLLQRYSATLMYIDASDPPEVA